VAFVKRHHLWVTYSVQAKPWKNVGSITYHHLYVHFFFRTACGKVNRTRMWLTMNSMGFSNTLLRLARLITEEQEISVRMYNRISTSFTSNIGLKQGDGLAPFYLIQHLK
jgi:hypothetical protein